MHLTADWDRLLANCPGAVARFPPPPIGFGAIDVRREWGFEATQYMSDRGVKYLTPDVSPVSGCFRVRFRYGRLTGLRQSFEDRRRLRTPTRQEVHESAEERTGTKPQIHQGAAHRLGRLLGRVLR